VSASFAGLLADRFHIFMGFASAFFPHLVQKKGAKILLLPPRGGPWKLVWLVHLGQQER
jgi:hypothetical protein